MASMSLPSNKNPERVAAGYKATIHNPTVSQAAKRNAEQHLREMGVSSETGSGTQHAKETVDTLDETEFSPDPDVMDTPSRGFIEEDVTHTEPGTYAGMEDYPEEGDSEEEEAGRSAGAQGGQAGERRSLGGYKATLKNPRVSEQAKEKARKILEDTTT